MKPTLLLFCALLSFGCFCQSLQLHYDVRGSLDPKRNPRNFVTLYYEDFKIQDSGRRLVKPGSFLLKMQADFVGDQGNMGKLYLQVSQSVRFWEPKIFLNLQYSGGLGITDPKQYSYYITNTYSVGPSYPFKWGSAYLTAQLNYKYVSYPRGTSDPLFTFYWWKGLLHYHFEFAGDFSVWTENRDHGDGLSPGLHGKAFYFFAEPQVWFNVNKGLSFGSKVNMNYHVLIADNVLQLYPTAAVRWKL